MADKEEAIWTCYLVECSDRTYYCGVTTDLKRRIAQHNAGTGAKYTKTRSPVKFITGIRCITHSAALKIETQVKGVRRSDKKDFLESFAKRKIRYDNH